MIHKLFFPITLCKLEIVFFLGFFYSVLNSEKGIKTSSKFEVLGYNVDPVNPERDAEAVQNGEKIFNIIKENNSYGFSLITNPAAGENEHEHCIKGHKGCHARAVFSGVPRSRFDTVYFLEKKR